MKKLLLSAAVIATLFAGCGKDEEKKDTTPVAGPQVPVASENTSLTQKFSGTKCPPCGGWGWVMADELIAYGDGKALYLGTFSQNFVAEGFITTVANDMDTKWAAGSKGYPVFAVNGALKADRPSGSVNTTNEKTMCKATMDAHAAAPVIANTGVKMTISGNKLSVKASAKFFQAASGDYNVAFYIVENSAMWKQSGNAASNGVTAIPHHYVLRGSINGTWGENMFSGSIAAGTYKDINKEFTMDPSWVAANMDVYAVIWKVNGTGYDFVNVSNAK